MGVGVLSRLSGMLTKWLTKDPEHPSESVLLLNFDRLSYELRPGDVILVEGRSKVSEVIKMTTQNPWTHAALYIGRLYEIEDEAASPLVADLVVVLSFRLLVQQIEGRVKDQFPVFDPPAGQPLDLHEELGTETEKRLLGNDFISLNDERTEHPVSPLDVLLVVEAIFVRNGVLEQLPELGVRRPQSGRIELLDIIPREVRRRE